MPGPKANTGRGGTCKLGATIGAAGAAGAAVMLSRCGAEVEYRTSSTPAYTVGLDLRYSTTNPATIARGRA